MDGSDLSAWLIPTGPKPGQFSLWSITRYEGETWLVQNGIFICYANFIGNHRQPNITICLGLAVSLPLKF